MASMTNEQKKKLIERYVEAANDHDIDGIVALFDPDCKLIVNEALIDDGMNKLKTKMEQELTASTSSVRLLNLLPVDEDDRVRAIFEINSSRQVDETLVLSQSGCIIQLIVHETPVAQ